MILFFTICVEDRSELLALNKQIFKTNRVVSDPTNEQLFHIVDNKRSLLWPLTVIVEESFSLIITVVYCNIHETNYWSSATKKTLPTFL